MVEIKVGITAGQQGLGRVVRIVVGQSFRKGCSQGDSTFNDGKRTNVLTKDVLTVREGTEGTGQIAIERNGQSIRKRLSHVERASDGSEGRLIPSKVKKVKTEIV